METRKIIKDNFHRVNFRKASKLRGLSRRLEALRRGGFRSNFAGHRFSSIAAKQTVDARTYAKYLAAKFPDNLFFRILVEKGILYRPKWIDARMLMPPGACHVNSLVLSSDPGCLYTEGIGITFGEAVLHSVVVRKDCKRAVDCTWMYPDAGTFFGVAFDHKFVYSLECLPVVNFLGNNNERFELLVDNAWSL